jgi:hypothetical protein
MIENMPDNEDENLNFESQIDQHEDIIRPRAEYHINDSNFVGAGQQNLEGAISASGLFNHNLELNSGEHG